jgi:signal transduction histidine kinase
MPHAYSFDPQLPASLAPFDAKERAVAERYLGLLANSPAPACLVWQDRGALRCVAHNDSFAALFGGRPLLGEPLLEVAPELRAAWSAALESVSAGVGTTCEPIPLPAARDGARTSHHGATWIPIAVDGVPRGALGLLHDASPMLERLRRLLGSVAHDLQDPLVGIRMLAHQMRDEAPSTTVESDRVIALTGRMSRLIHELGWFSRLASGEGMRLRARPCDLGAIVHGTCEELSAHGMPPLSVTTESMYGMWDADAIRRLCTNLINNARRHGPRGGTVSVRCQVVESTAVIEVADEGRGFDQAEAAQLFEPWRRGSAARANEGAGLGLFIVREIVRSHAGRVISERLEPSGFVMRVTLPFGGSGVIKRVER